MRRRHILAGAMLAPLARPSLAQQPWPSRPLRLVMPGAPGGNPDILARLWAVKLSERLGQAVTVDNRPGASGIIGTEGAMNSAPDGYTMLFGYNQLVTLNKLLFRRLPYDPERMTRVALMSDTPYVMLLHSSIPATTIPELVAWCRANPGKLAHGTGGPGTFSHLTGELLQRAAGIETLHVPHRATPRNELISGQVQLAVEPMALALTLTQMATQAVRAALAIVFDCTAAEQVRAITDARNDASIRLIERVGMRFITSQATVFRDEACVELVYAIQRLAVKRQDLPLHAAHARLPGSRFMDVDLSQSFFDDVSLRGASFNNISLAGASLCNVSLEDVTIADATLDGMRIEGVLVTDLWAAWQRGT